MDPARQLASQPAREPGLWGAWGSTVGLTAGQGGCGLGQLPACLVRKRPTATPSGPRGPGQSCSLAPALLSCPQA